MPGLLNADTSSSSRQELLDLQDYTPDGDTGLDSQSHSPIGSAPRSPSSLGADVSAHVFTGATSFQGQFCELGPAQCGNSPMEQDSDQLCGWGSLRPKAIQVFNTPRWVLFFLSVASFLQGLIINGLINTVVTSIERRFDLSSSQTGLIVSSYDIAACVCLAFASYFGGNGHKPRWLGWGIMIMGLGSLVFALPHFTTPAYQVSSVEVSDLCSGANSSLCEGKGRGGLSRYSLVFMLSQFLHGIGATPLYTLGVTYLDQNVHCSAAPVYIGIFYTAATVGPAVGYLVGGYFLNIFTEIHIKADVTPDNPLWVGGWWIGFLGGGALSLLVAIPILGYPRELPGSQETAAIRVSEAHQGKEGSHASTSDPQFGKTLRDMPRCVLLLLKNPTFLFLCLAGASDANLIAAMSTFGPKILESQFSLSASKAAAIFGSLVVPAGGGGTFLGGYIVQRCDLRCRGIIRFCAVCCSLSLLSAFVFFVHCPDVSMAGVTAPYGIQQMDSDLGEASWGSLTSTSAPANSSSLDERLLAQCNSNCSCDRLFNPVCGADHRMYFSPCYAGCTSINLTSEGQVYSNCSCVVANSSHERLALAGRCSTACPYMPLFLTVFFFCILFTFLTSIPAITATLRCVTEKQKSFALGIQWILVRTLGAIPGPIIFGSMVDRSCLLWQDKCGEQGSCFVYKNTDMSRFTLIAGIIYKILATILFLLASLVYRAPPDSPRSSCESTTDPGTADLSCKTPPADGVIVNRHARDD
ncbi:solute carrier organic anion transporter family member 4A1-like [Periophthalmus magnuspinnatus]|uniref:solute carrier organic anion transporter family member 4A1-like n=1 Tax=Periophthalmus magnuspinnatus TaxID=409849 RepID=UPI00145AB904|nr:solute carrier organic anion transporter family member 4A1-like [Periophthalmus magnuspinnatus]